MIWRVTIWNSFSLHQLGPRGERPEHSSEASMMYWAALLLMESVTCTFVKALLMLSDTYTCCQVDDVDLREGLAYLSKTMPNLILHIPHHGFVVLNWSACSTDLSFTENICHITKSQDGIVEQLNTYIKQEWENIPFAKLQLMVSSVPKYLQSIQRRGETANW